MPYSSEVEHLTLDQGVGGSNPSGAAMRIESFYVMSDSELNKLIMEAYGFKDWSIAAEEEIGNDSSFTCYLDYDVPDFEIEHATTYLKEKQKSQWSRIYGTRYLMLLLMKEGRLRPGNYLIEICW